VPLVTLVLLDKDKDKDKVKDYNKDIIYTMWTIFTNQIILEEIY
jgi:hypothetical protein